MEERENLFLISLSLSLFPCSLTPHHVPLPPLLINISITSPFFTVPALTPLISLFLSLQLVKLQTERAEEKEDSKKGC